MLDSIWIENFKSYKTGQSLPLAPITLMIGANASGKSNAIEALRFLSWFASGEKLSTIKNRINDSEKIFRGNIQDVFSKGKKNICLGASLAEGTIRYFDQWKFIIGINEDGNLYVEDEYITLYKNKEKFLYIKNKKNENFDNRSDDLLFLDSYYKNELIINDFKDNGIHIHYQTYDIDSDSSVLDLASTIVDDQLKVYLDKDKNDRAYMYAKLLSNHFRLIRLRILANIDFYDFIPSKMRQESEKSNFLKPNGLNISGVLYKLWEDNNYKDDILKFIRSLPEQEFKSLKFYKDHRDRVELALIESFGNEEREWGVELLSDGTLRVLGIAAAILSASERSIVVIEEMDNGIHPSRAKYLLENMFHFAEKKNIKLLISTHNPALMDALPDQALGDVVFAYRDPKEGDSRLVRLSDLEDYVGLVSQGPLGELVTQGIVDRFVKNPISKEDKKQKALSWLNEMRGASNE